MQDLDLFLYPKNRLAEADTALASSLKGLVEKEIMEKRLELKEDYEELLRPAMKKVFVEIGLQKMFWPQDLGGEEHNRPEAAYTIVAALEQLGRADMGLSFLASHSLALQASLAQEGFVNKEACSRFAPLFCDGKESVIVSFLFPTYAEEEGPRWYGKYYQVTAEEADGGWVLKAERARPTCSGADADLFGAWCFVEGGDPAFVLVPGDSAGLKRDEEFKKTGLAASRNADISLDGVKVSGENTAFRGEKEYRRLLSWFYLGLSATAAGGLLAAYEILKEWGDTRVIKGRGQIFKENPLTASLMAQSAQDIFVARQLTYQLAGIMAEPETYGDAASEGVYTAATMVVQHVYASAETVLHRIMELMASAGYAKEWQLERYWRDVKTIQCYLGACEAAKFEVARWFYQCRTL
jgi:alkylation response protein AidB-like acyl-CoA dehydrogenase